MVYIASILDCSTDIRAALCCKNWERRAVGQEVYVIRCATLETRYLTDRSHLITDRLSHQRHYKTFHLGYVSEYVLIDLTYTCL